MRLTRRNLLQLAGGVATAAAAPSCGESGPLGSSTGSILSSSGALPEPFSRPLPVPPVLRPVRTDGTTDHYEITQRVGRADIVPGRATEIWGYNGSFPGPTIVTRRGRRAVVRHRNELPVPVVVHLHGAKTPPEDDGYPTDLLLPVSGWTAGSHGGSGEHDGGSRDRDRPRVPGTAGHGSGMTGAVTTGERDYRYPMDQPAATLWYHDHRMDFTGPQVYRGLAGFHLHHDAEEEALPLPGGDRDIPLMICDRAFTGDGGLRYPALDPRLRDQPGVQDRFMTGVMGDVILVNGAAWPVLEVSNTRYRFRILNASNARRYRLSLDPAPDGGTAFIQVGSDAGLLDRPIRHERLDIAQAERFDVVVDFSRYPVGTRVTLRNEFGKGRTGQVMRFVVARRARDDSTVPDRLVELERLSRTDAVTTRRFVFHQGGDGWVINGSGFHPDRIDARPRLGTTELWRLNTDAHHPIHLHLAHFQVLRRNGRGPGRSDAGWKDTVDVPAGQDLEILARFTGFRGKYVFHCHNLEHEDMAMMGNIAVV